MDDFSFDFEPDLSNTICVAITPDESNILGHIYYDSDGTSWLIGAYMIAGSLEEVNTLHLKEVPNLRLCEHIKLFAIANSDAIRIAHSSAKLNMAYLNKHPIPCNSLRH